jgi:acyl-homoserine lactone acylase PvdQ
MLLALALPPLAHAQVQPYQANDGRGFRNILPSGQNGTLNALDLGAYVASGTRPKHSNDQLRMYGDLVYNSPGVTSATLPRFFKDASFGVRPGDVERTYSPRSDVTIERDKGFGIPHIYGKTRAGTMFGAGYAGAEDRLFFMDVLRNVGRGKLSSFAGGAAGNRAQDEDIWSQAPYTEADLQRQYDRFDDLYGAEGKQIQADVANYVAGIQAYINEARINPLKMPAEYAAIGKLSGPANWSVGDVVASATLVGAIFGKGGGRELDSALALQASTSRFGAKKGTKVWRDFRAAEDPEAPVTVLKKRFPYQRAPKKVAKGSLALPDRGSVTKVTPRPSAASATRAGAQRRGLVDGLVRSDAKMSNALLVSARESASGHPLAVFGPQVAYFNPQILNEIDLHGPGIDARGAAFNGVSLYVTLGRGRDYAWSATSASQDIIDTFAVDLCSPSGRKPTKGSMFYRFRGRCLPMEVLTRTNSWQPNAADSTPAGSETLRALRTKLGLVVGRATIRGKPVAYTKLRSTYMHEADAAVGISRFNNPNVIRDARSFQRAAAQLHYTFHWLYADSKDIAYINTGDNPIRAKNVNQSLPTRARFEWRNFDPNLFRASYVSFAKRPQVINQRYIVNWNNKSARGYAAADANWEYSSIYRSKLLEDRVKRGIKGARKMTLPKLVDAMETAGYTDLRGDSVLPYALRALGRQRNPRLRNAIATLRKWQRAGSPRRDANHDNVYEYTAAVRIMDAWWPLWIKAAYQPTLGPKVFQRFFDFKIIDNDPNNHGAHLGSAYQGGTYGLTQRDLRTLLGRKRLKGLKGPPSRKARYSRTYCGGSKRRKGTLRRCRKVLARTLLEATTKTPAQVYGKDPICDKQPGLGPKDPGRQPGNQWCHDAVWMRALGAAEQPVIHWINRPTFQQAVEVQARAPR